MTSVDWSDRSAYDARRYVACMEFLVSLLGGSCVECGGGDGLEFDHVDPDTKSFAIASKWTASMSILAPELVKCQLLCSDCHLSKTRIAQSVGHGQGKTGKRNCKCAPCRSQKAEYMRAYRLAR
ncbi:hypothetical protein [Streptomyces sp. ITFR-6]|uniref:hypothetical protein n=1 Tax=Streptomyces sp. ITFR-6 TaxID=3075197 RepID=UPI002889EA9B|nr:hypothetical protein [Streptomyces sp. ITFR-6]WNI28680.1 hypothetical protein RLT59_07655 [Streptomyces sp. ITFR-6]